MAVSLDLEMHSQCRILLILLLSITHHSTSLDIHVGTSHHYGTSVFNTTFGPGWTYTVDKMLSSSPAQSLLLVQHYTGILRISSTPHCENIVHNPFIVLIGAKHTDQLGHTNHTVLPFRTFVHGPNCHVKYRRKALPSQWNHPVGAFSISVQLQRPFGSCFHQNDTIISLYDHLPLFFKDCSVSGTYTDEFNNFSKFDSGQLTVNETFCFNFPSHVLHIDMYISSCDKLLPGTWLHGKIILYALEFPFTTYSKYKGTYTHNKMRRETRNTPPEFSQPHYVEYADEELSPGYINTITVSDPDSGDDGRITYTLLATQDGRSQHMFSMDSTNGLLRTTQMLDRETIPVHHFLVTAVDHGKPNLSATASLTIYVNDVNDHAPQFESSVYPRVISESVSVGTTVLTVRASDEDSGSNAEVEYIILNPSGANEAFRIEPRLGSIIVRQPLDREKKDHYRLEIQASDRALITQRLSSTAVVEITLQDENDNRPQFFKSSYTIEVREDIDPSDHPVIAEIKATDSDFGPNGIVRYSITSGNYMDTFAVDAVTGQLSLIQHLDYETNQQYHLSVRAQDNGSPYKSNSTMVLIKVQDINDNDPKFYSSLYQESVLENEEVGHTVMRVQAFDADSGLNSALIYSVLDTTEQLPFDIDTNTGILTTTDKLDREVSPEYDFVVHVMDQGMPSRTSSTRIQIRIRDVNDNAPIFEPRIYSELVSEEAFPGTAVLTVTARDKDENARVTYTIADGNINQAFSIDSQMGQGLIRVARILNYQEQSRYILSVKASDGHLEDTATVFINISDANTHRPIFQNTPYQVRVDENKPVGSSIYKVHAVDNDVGENARITYLMDENAAFEIDSMSGEISIKHPLDRELVSGFTISIFATDHGRPPKTDSTDIEISVEDVNDNQPFFREPQYIGRIEEDTLVGTSVLTIEADDEDIGLNGRIRYTFEGGNSGGGDFRIDPVLGILRVNKELDRERIDIYKLLAFAVDRGTPERSTSVLITIYVDDINDNAPKFESSQIDMFVLENSPIGTTVGSISALDRDAGVNAEVEYSIHDGADSDSFSLSLKTFKLASIVTDIELDYEGVQRDYIIVIRARSAHLFSDATITIHVQDANDNLPQLDDFIIIFNNYMNHFPTGEIGRIPAHDPDQFDQLHYNFISGNEANIVHLNELTGMIRLDPRLNSDVPTNATLQVLVDDGINEVRRNCWLFVRLVTEDMLTNSTTVRLNSIDQKTFLSMPLYNLFVKALASIIPTTDDNIFIINVQDDTDVHNKVLNVSFAVRSHIVNNEDYFLQAQFLQEKVYLHRALLAQLSMLQVLPFDDNLCLMEPCFNFDQCSVIQKFGNASEFIGSSTMLFRPIHLINQFECTCPRGFTGMSTGYLCDTEVNLCYSNPCGSNGSCVSFEGGYTCHCHQGYTGKQCTIDLKEVHYDVCPPDICKQGSHCVPLIRGGLRCQYCQKDSSDANHCEDCKEKPYHDDFCRLKTRSFSRGSFLVFPSLKRRHRFSIRLRFATRHKDGILLYNGRYNERHDFIALEIVNGQVEFSFSLGSGVTKVQPVTDKALNDGQWHEVTIQYHNRSAAVTVGEFCDTQLAIHFGKDLKYQCAAQTSHALDQRCDDPLQFCHRFLDLTGPFQIGGLPNLPTDFQVLNTHFIGCISDVYIDEKFLDLNDFVFNNQTKQGCYQKYHFCQSRPCFNKGNCVESWDSYLCDCPEEWGGKDCSQKIEVSCQLLGNSYLYYNGAFGIVSLPWFNGIAFRTHQVSALLVMIVLGKGTDDDPVEHIHIHIVNGYIKYSHPRKTLVMDSVMVNDGKWHYFEARWIKEPPTLILTLDYGQSQHITDVDNHVEGKALGAMYVGGLVDTTGLSPVIKEGFLGCVKDVRLGNSENSILSKPLRYNAGVGCLVDDGPCDENNDLCPLQSNCERNFGEVHCSCTQGHVGPDCKGVCSNYNPCQHGSRCEETNGTHAGYQCLCLANYTGQHCEHFLNDSCPLAWWGSPICGPCNCPIHKGFDVNCHKVTGLCSCREHHYKPPAGDTCYFCDCYSWGSLGPTCDMESGQCICKEGVIGRRCDRCTSKFAEVTLRGCEMQYDDCPRAIHSHIWWPRTPLNQTALHECPMHSAGKARRFCHSIDGWHKPDLSECISDAFITLHQQLQKLEDNSLEMNAYLARNLVREMNAGVMKVSSLYLADLNITYALLIHVLAYETSQSGLGLTHTQDKNFIQNIVNVAGHLLEQQNLAHWRVINQQHAGTVEILYYLEKYSITLARNMQALFMQPVDIIHPNIVFGLDTILSSNHSYINIPKYNNKIRQTQIFDDTTKVDIPVDMLKFTSGAKFGSDTLLVPQIGVAYIIFRTIGNLLPQKYDQDVRLINNVSISANAPVFTVNILHKQNIIEASPKHPVKLNFLEMTQHNRTSPQCVHWKYLQHQGLFSGMWSTEGCRIMKRRNGEIFSCEDSTNCSYQTREIIECECDHMTSFSILMDVSDIPYGPGVLKMEIITYVCIAISLTCACVTLILLCCLRSINSNLISIHMNLTFCILLVQLIFLVGMNKTDPEIGCRIVAILLNYFYLCSFFWIFVETLHLYRMLTEVRNIDEGAMKFYFLLGYVIPGIAVGLAVGLKTDQFGNSSFCWLRTDNMIIWSFAGPICFIFGCNVAVFMMALKASCDNKKGVPDFSHIRFHLKAGLVMLPLLGVAWVFGLLAINEDILAFHYLFAIFTCLQGLFILLVYIIFCKQTRNHLQYQFYKLKGRKDLDESISGPAVSMLSRSVLAYQNDNMDGRHSSSNIRVSTSTSKSSSGIYRQDMYVHTTSSTSTSGSNPATYDLPPNAGIPPYGKRKTDEQFQAQPEQKVDSDSDSELSAIEHPDLELASSHTSDEDEDEQYRWSKA